LLRSVRVAATYEKVGLTPRYSRALHLSIFEQPLKVVILIIDWEYEEILKK
jgi:hypothetical protein